MTKNNAYTDCKLGKTPVFYVMDFILHWNNTRGGIGWGELKGQKEMTYDELMIGSSCGFRVIVATSKVGEYHWFGVDKFLVRIR